MSGDGLIGASGCLSRGRNEGRLIPAGRGNDPARGLASPQIRFRPSTAWPPAPARSTSAMPTANASSASRPRSGSTPMRTGSPTSKAPEGQLVYVYAAVRALLAWKPARFSLVENGVQSRLTGYNVVVANTAFTAAA